MPIKAVLRRIGHIVELAEQFGVGEKKLETMFGEVNAAVERWTEFARVAGVSRVVTGRRFLGGWLG